MATCEICKNEFNSDMGVEQHKLDKHKIVKEVKPVRKLPTRALFYTSLIIFSLFFISKLSGNATGAVVSDAEIPKEPIHWHPHLTIKINGNEMVIPANIGIGSVHYPIHTHETDNILHVENNYPSAKTVSLGYFFEVWQKKFDKDCIFDYCTNETHEMKMYVNGAESFEYGDYVMKDLDKIVISYDAKSNSL